jgi:hypothetical protein
MQREQYNPLVAILDKSLRSAGFKRQDKTWRLVLADTIHMVALEKSRWGDQYQIILGIFVLKLGSGRSPKYYECHITQSLELLFGATGSAGPWVDEHGEPLDDKQVPDVVRQVARHVDRSLDVGTLDEGSLNWILEHRPLLARALDLEDPSLNDDRRREIVERAMRDKGLPFLRALQTQADICAALRKGRLEGVAVWKLVYEFCGLQPP